MTESNLNISFSDWQGYITVDGHIHELNGTKLSVSCAKCHEHTDVFVYKPGRELQKALKSRDKSKLPLMATWSNPVPTPPNTTPTTPTNPLKRARKSKPLLRRVATERVAPTAGHRGHNSSQALKDPAAPPSPTKPYSPKGRGFYLRKTAKKPKP